MGAADAALPPLRSGGMAQQTLTVRHTVRRRGGMTKQPKYLNQWGRVQRWYQRFGEISDRKLHDRSSDLYQDEVYSFFYELQPPEGLD